MRLRKLRGRFAGRVGGDPIHRVELVVNVALGACHSLLKQEQRLVLVVLHEGLRRTHRLAREVCHASGVGGQARVVLDRLAQKALGEFCGN